MRAVLFDLDGVLVDSYEAWFYVVNEAARSFGVAPITREALTAAFGQGISEDQRVWFPAASLEEIQAVYDRAMPASIERIEANPEARSVLSALGEAGIGRAVVTNTPAGVGAAVLASMGLRDVVDHLAAMRPGIREKPHPDLLVEALAATGAASHDAVMVGDTDYDRVAAEAAGVEFVHYVMKSGASLAAALQRVGCP